MVPDPNISPAPAHWWRGCIRAVDQHRLLHRARGGSILCTQTRVYCRQALMYEGSQLERQMDTADLGNAVPPKGLSLKQVS